MNRLRPANRKQAILAIVGAMFGICLLFSFVGALLPSPSPIDPPAASDSRAAILELDTPTPPSSTNTPAPTATPEPSEPPSTPQPSEPTATREPPTPTPALPRAASNANLRAGPGQDYPIVGSTSADTPLDIVAINHAGDWHQLASGAWIAAFLVSSPPTDLPIATAPPLPQPSPVPTSPPAAPAVASSLQGIRLLVIQNVRTFEIIEIRNTSPNPVDIGGWALYGSRGDETCVIPAGVILQPAQGYQIATGDSQPGQPGYKCGDKTIWNNKGETIYLRTHDGQTLQITT